MRSIVVVSGAIAVTAAVGFGLVFLTARSKRAGAEHIQSRATPTAEATGATDSGSVMKRLAVGQLARAGLVDQKVSALDQRLRAIEARGAAADAAEAATAADSDSEVSAPKPLSEGALGDWMLDELRLGNGNRDWTLTAESQVDQSLADLPDLEVEAVECGDRFGRATFFSYAGGPPDVSALLGLPPFDNEAFTAPNADGTVSIYFTAPGVKVEELRAEATSAATPM